MTRLQKKLLLVSAAFFIFQINLFAQDKLPIKFGKVTVGDSDVEELPKSARIILNEDEGMFEYLISADESRIQMRSRLQIKKTFFPNADYQTLRDFYAYIVKKESEQIVFKKKK